MLVLTTIKNGDFKPYVLKSSDKGATWKAMSGDLPERGSVFYFCSRPCKQ